MSKTQVKFNNQPVELTEQEQAWLDLLSNNDPEEMAGALYDLIFFYIQYAPTYIDHTEYQLSLIYALQMAQALKPMPTNQFAHVPGRKG